MFVMHTLALTDRMHRLSRSTSHTVDKRCNVLDCAQDYDTRQLNGAWIEFFIKELDTITKAYFNYPSGRLRIAPRIEAATFHGLVIDHFTRNDYSRYNYVIEFVNKYYNSWAKFAKGSIEPYERIAPSMRHSCRDCLSGWEFPLDKWGNKMLDEKPVFACRTDCGPFQNIVMDEAKQLWKECKAILVNKLNSHWLEYTYATPYVVLPPLPVTWAAIPELPIAEP